MGQHPANGLNLGNYLVSKISIQPKKMVIYVTSEYWSQKHVQNDNIHSTKLDVYAEQQSMSNPFSEY